MEFERTKVFEEQYNLIRVNEEDIARIAKIIEKHTKNGDNKINIVVKSSDGKDVYKSHDLRFFLCDEMPRYVGLISIIYSNYKDSLKCSLILDTRRSKPVELIVSGSDSRVSALFLDLEEELVAKQVFGHKILDVADKFWFGFGLSLLLAAAIYFVFDTWLDFFVETLPGFERSSTHITIGGIGWTAIFVMATTGFIWIEHVIKKIFSPIQFSGKISDPSAKARKIRFWLFTAILLPLIIGIMPDVAFGLIDTMFELSL